MIDVDHQISAVERQVGTRTLEAGEARLITVTQTYDADIEDVWDACTNPERIPRWLMPISGDLRIGGHYQLEGNAGGTVQTCDPPNGFTATWEFGGDTSWIDVQLSPAGERRTRLRLEHVAHVDDTRWAEFGPSAVGIGWDMMLLGLAGHVGSEQSVATPDEAAAWMMTDEARRFMGDSADRWAAASIAAGDEPDVARRAADRTFAVYTGAAPDGDADASV